MVTMQFFDIYMKDIFAQASAEVKISGVFPHLPFFHFLIFLLQLLTFFWVLHVMRDWLILILSPVLTSDASISTSISISIKDAYALVRTATT